MSSSADVRSSSIFVSCTVNYVDLKRKEIRSESFVCEMSKELMFELTYEKEGRIFRLRFLLLSISCASFYIPLPETDMRRNQGQYQLCV